jgi:hypothetical protein
LLLRVKEWTVPAPYMRRSPWKRLTALVSPGGPAAAEALGAHPEDPCPLLTP